MQIESVIGHRGAAAYAPENTLQSFEAALNLGCRFVEFDVMQSLDGELFIFHDDTLNRTTNGSGYFHEANAEIIRELDAGRWFSEMYTGVKVPSFKEAIQWLNKNQVQANIEIKPGATNRVTLVQQLLAELKAYWQSASLPLISSFDIEVLKLVQVLAPDLKRGLLLHSWHENWLDLAKDIEAYSIHYNHACLTERRVDAIKTHTYPLCVYTVNRKSLAKTLFSWGVDAVFSDYPDLLK